MDTLIPPHIRVTFTSPAASTLWVAMVNPTSVPNRPDMVANPPQNRIASSQALVWRSGVARGLKSLIADHKASPVTAMNENTRVSNADRQGAAAYEAEFEFGLDLILNGLERLRPERDHGG